jgi:two-component system NtrC family sensor kinase
LNARDAMEDGGGALIIRSAHRDGAVRVTITDTGSGIAPQHLLRIFDPFFTTKGAKKGTGLGLSVSYGIVREHGGEIEVRSEPGKGTTFELIFPPPGSSWKPAAARAASIAAGAAGVISQPMSQPIMEAPAGQPSTGAAAAQSNPVIH